MGNQENLLAIKDGYAKSMIETNALQNKKRLRAEQNQMKMYSKHQGGVQLLDNRHEYYHQNNGEESFTNEQNQVQLRATH